MRSRPLACVRFLGLIVTFVLAFCSALSRSMVLSKSCSALAMLLAMLYFAYAIVLVAVRPHRDPVDLAAAPVFETCFGILCCLKYANASRDASSSLQLFVSVLIGLTAVHALWRRYRISEALVGSDGDNSTCPQMETGVPLMELMSDVEVSESSHPEEYFNPATNMAILSHDPEPPTQLERDDQMLHRDRESPTSIKDVHSIVIDGPVDPAKFDTVLQQLGGLDPGATTTTTAARKADDHSWIGDFNSL
jgi:hypothetical protein